MMMRAFCNLEVERFRGANFVHYDGNEALRTSQSSLYVYETTRSYIFKLAAVIT
jgi:hypothetical protein